MWKPDPYYGLGIGREAFTSILDSQGLPLTYGGATIHHDPVTSDALIASFHPAPGKTTVTSRNVGGG